MKAIYNHIGKLALLVLLSLCFNGHAHAANCTAYSGLPGPLTYSGTINVPANLQPGDAIPNTLKNFSISGTCNLGTGSPLIINVGSSIVMCSLDGGSTEVMPGIYTSAVTGIGVRIRDGYGNLVTNAGGQACRSSVATVQSGGYYSFSGSLELVRLTGTIPQGAQISGGPTGNGAFAFGVYNTNVVLNGGALGLSSVYPVGSIVFKNIACNLDYPQTVNLPDVSAQTMNTQLTAGDTAFTIGVTCNLATNASISFSPASGFSLINASTAVIGIQVGAGMATGVGLQLLKSDDTTPVSINTFSTLGALTANVRSPFQYYGRYYRTGANVTGGSVQSAVDFTMSYQ